MGYRLYPAAGKWLRNTTLVDWLGAVDICFVGSTEVVATNSASSVAKLMLSLFIQYFNMCAMNLLGQKT
jgi:hypothetical protein